MGLDILIPYATLLQCRLDTTVLVVDNKDIRRIGEIVTFYKKGGWDFLMRHLPAEKDKSWWEKVRFCSENFCWDLYRTPSLPTVKPFDGTLEFYGGGGNHRAMALAVRGGQEAIPVILNL
jgi:hypothetical protein